MAAVNKVVAMLEGLQTQVLGEGEAEAKTYNEFSCFCKDTTAEKTDAIQKGTDEKASLAATIEGLASDRDNLDIEIAGLLEDLEAADKAMKEAKSKRKEELMLYEKNDADLVGALEALEGAIKVLKASSSPSLVQLKSIGETLRTAVLMADALGLSGSEKVAGVFLQQAPEVAMENYKFHSNDIIGTLEGLLKDFRAEKVTVDEEEVKSVAAHDAFMQEQTDIVKAKNVELDDAKATKNKKIEEIAMNTEQLTTVAATLLDDQEYIMELSQMCSRKAQTWDQRSKVRQDELSTLTAVIAIIKGAVSEKTTAATIRFAQMGAGKRLADAAAQSPDAMELIEAAAEDADASFLQLSRRVKRASFLAPKAKGDVRDAVLELFRSKGEQLHSTLLTSLASKIAGAEVRSSDDPFAKVKVLIQELIERLLKEAGNEANQKGWCDKALQDAEQKRDHAATEVEQLNGEMASLEALRDTLGQQLSVLGEEIQQLNESRAEAVAMRMEEKAQNAATVREAGEGLDALNEAITILDRFYKTVKKETVEYSFAQGPADDAPDAGFKNGEAYTGAQGAAGGILGMLDVMKSDFQRTITETEKAEAEAEQDHLEFMTETGKSLAMKTTAHKEKTTQKDEAEEKLASAEEGLGENMAILQTSIKELIELQPACIDTGMSYEERVARREDEIAALNKGLCILEAYAQYGPDGLSDAC